MEAAVTVIRTVWYWLSVFLERCGGVRRRYVGILHGASSSRLRPAEDAMTWLVI